MNDRSCGDKGITFSTPIGHVKARTYPGHGFIHGQNAVGKGWQHACVKPLAQQPTLSLVSSLHKENALL